VPSCCPPCGWASARPGGRRRWCARPCFNRYAAGGADRGAPSAYELFAEQLAAARAEVLPAEAAVWALWLRAMGLDHLGAPLVERSARQRAALREVAWPTPAERGEPR
jgi:hypothetical protein